MYNAQPAFWATIPFFVLLSAIATMPLVNGRWWGKYYPAVTLGISLPTMVYYLAVLHDPVPLTDSLYQYAGFIALIGSLFIIAGGIHIRLKGRSRPLTNVLFLGAGALAANFIGTTGASMILIRPYLRVNKYRIKPYHVIFFIFVVSNIGGALTPVGDPPLFVGYLKGIPFFWSIVNLWYIWALAVAAVLIVFYLIDLKSFREMSRGNQNQALGEGEQGEVQGLHNLIFLSVVLVAVFVTHPPFLREALMVAAAAGSYLTTPSQVHRKNMFDFVPIKEVAILFAGIFITMVPALEWIGQHASGFGLGSPGEFYWMTGALSSVLDNTPTYLNLLSAAIGRFVGGSQLVSSLPPAVLLLSAKKVVVQAISIGAVFFGAMTYIGNGPNFMVKSISEQSGVECPPFLTYVLRYSVPILLPIFILIWLIFFR